MEFLKRHYEKLILTVVLAGLLGAAGWLLWQVKQVGIEVDKAVDAPDNKAEVENQQKYNDIIVKLKTPAPLDLDKLHHVFNPWTWYLRTNDQQIVRGSDIGPRKLQISKHTPLHLVVDAKASTTTDRTNITLYFTREYHTNANLRTAIPRSTQTGGTAKLDDTLRALLKEATGFNTPELQFVVDIHMTNEPPVLDYKITPGNPYKRIMGYAIDLAYPLEPLPAIPANRRVGDTITFGGESYKIIAIKDTEFIVESVSTEKRTIIPIPIRPRQ
ncbi:MAG: hypothetical protein FJ386_11360 [Verrucomicrobia bacterium]|nr:hypothetical protein [Verrucomicrobiota bacterium]